MTTYAGPPVFPPYFVDPLGKPQRSVKITVYERGTDTKPDLYADREKSTPTSNPFWATSLGNAEFRVDAIGEFDAEVNGVRIPFTVVGDPEEPVTIAAGAVEEAMLAFGVATQAELDAGLAGKQATIPPGTYVPKFSPASPKPGRELYVMDYLSAGRTPGTTQDTSGILTAIAAAAGNTLIFPPGLYRADDVLEFDGLDDVTVVAHGAAIILDDDGTAEGRVIRATNCENFRWLGGQLRQTAAARTGLNGLLTLETVDRFHVDVETIGGSGAGVSLLTATNGRLNVIARDSRADGVHVNRGSAHCQIYPLVSGSGDDAVGVVSNTGTAQTSDITVVAPMVSAGAEAIGSGVVFVGAKDSQCIGGLVDGMPVNIGQVSGGGAYHAASNITFRGLQGRGGYRSFSVGASTDTRLDGCVGRGASDVALVLLTGAIRPVVDGGAYTGAVFGVYETGATSAVVHDADLRNNSGAPANVLTATLVDCIT